MRGSELTQGPAIATGKRRFEVAILATFTALLVAASYQHDMWRDEIQAWLISRDSPTPWSIVGNLRYDGHPLLWYLLIWPASQLTRAPDAMKLITAPLAIGGVALFLWCGPWSRIEKLTWPLGYYILYEYGTKSRSYTVGVVLLFAVCALWPRREQRLITISLLLGLMANTHVFFGIMAAALAAGLVVERLSRFGPRGFRLGYRESAAIALFIAMAAFGAYVAAPPAAGDYSAPVRLPLSALFLAFGAIVSSSESLARIGMPMTIVQPFFYFSLLVALVWLGASITDARRNPAVITFMTLGLLGVIGVFAFVYAAGTQHMGMLLLIMVATEWLRRQYAVTPGGAGSLRSSCRVLFATSLACQALTGASVTAYHLAHPFSNGRQAAEFVRAHGWADDPVAGLTPRLTTVCGYLRKDWCLYADRDQRSSFMVFNGAPGAVNKSDIGEEELDRALARADELGPRVTFIMPYRWTQYPSLMSRHGFDRVATLTGAMTENYIIYRKGE